MIPRVTITKTCAPATRGRQRNRDAGSPFPRKETFFIGDRLSKPSPRRPRRGTAGSFLWVLALLVVVTIGPAKSAPPSIGLLPQDKTPVEVDDSERNPFGKKVVKTAEAVVETESEEQKIRALVEKLPFGGITRGYGVVKVLLGSYMLEKDGLLPDVIPGQTERLRVMEVSEKHVELGFVEEDGSVSSRLIKLSFDLKPVVRYKLGNKKVEATEGSDILSGVKKDAAGTSR